MVDFYPHTYWVSQHRPIFRAGCDQWPFPSTLWQTSDSRNCSATSACLRLNLQVHKKQSWVAAFPSWCSGTAEEDLWRLWDHGWLWHTQLRPQPQQRNLKWWNPRLHPQDVWDWSFWFYLAQMNGVPEQHQTLSQCTQKESPGEVDSRRTKIPKFSRRKQNHILQNILLENINKLTWKSNSNSRGSKD